MRAPDWHHLQILAGFSPKHLLRKVRCHQKCILPNPSSRFDSWKVQPLAGRIPRKLERWWVKNSIDMSRSTTVTSLESDNLHLLHSGNWRPKSQARIKPVGKRAPVSYEVQHVINYRTSRLQTHVGCVSWSPRRHIRKPSRTPFSFFWLCHLELTPSGISAPNLHVADFY